MLERDGEQLEMALGDVRVKLPWNGRSPRDLTRVALSGIFKARAVKSVSEFVDADQGDLFEAPAEEGPREFPGAPLLLEPRRGSKT